MVAVHKVAGPIPAKRTDKANKYLQLKSVLLSIKYLTARPVEALLLYGTKRAELTLFEKYNLIINSVLASY